MLLILLVHDLLKSILEVYRGIWQILIEQGAWGLWTCSAKGWAPAWRVLGKRGRAVSLAAAWREMWSRMNYWKHGLQEEGRSQSHKCKDLILFWASMGQVWTQTGGTGRHPQWAQPECSNMTSPAVKQYDGWRTRRVLLLSFLHELWILCSSFITPMSDYA